MFVYTPKHIIFLFNTVVHTFAWDWRRRDRFLAKYGQSFFIYKWLLSGPRGMLIVIFGESYEKCLTAVILDMSIVILDQNGALESEHNNCNSFKILHTFYFFIKLRCWPYYIGYIEKNNSHNYSMLLCKKWIQNILSTLCCVVYNIFQFYASFSRVIVSQLLFSFLSTLFHVIFN